MGNPPSGWIRACVWKESNNLPAPKLELCRGLPGQPHTRVPRPAAAAPTLLGVCVVFLQGTLVHTGGRSPAHCHTHALPVSASCLLAPLRWDPGSFFLCLVDCREGLWLRAELGSTPPLPPRLGNRCPGILGTGLTACKHDVRNCGMQLMWC